jgi:hypothetical protein
MIWYFLFVPIPFITLNNFYCTVLVFLAVFKVSVKYTDNYLYFLKFDSFQSLAARASYDFGHSHLKGYLGL